MPCINRLVARLRSWVILFLVWSKVLPFIFTGCLIMPRLLLAKNAGEDFERFDHILHTGNQGFIISIEQYFDGESGHASWLRLLQDDLFVTTGASAAFRDASNCISTGSRLFKKYGFNPVSSNATPAKIYVSRDKSARRKVVNEEELVQPVWLQEGFS